MLGLIRVIKTPENKSHTFTFELGLYQRPSYNYMVSVVSFAFSTHRIFVNDGATFNLILCTFYSKHAFVFQCWFTVQQVLGLHLPHRTLVEQYYKYVLNSEKYPCIHVDLLV